MRQFAILYRRSVRGEFKRLEKFVDANLYNRPLIASAIRLMRDNPAVQGMALVEDDETFNIVCFDQEAISARAFVAGDFEDVVSPCDSRFLSIPKVQTH